MTAYNHRSIQKNNCKIDNFIKLCQLDKQAGISVGSRTIYLRLFNSINSFPCLKELTTEVYVILASIFIR